MSDIFGIPADILLTLFMVGVPFLFILVVFWKDSRSAGKALILHFKSERQAEFMDKHVSEGVIKIGKKVTYVDEENPVLVRDGIFFKHWRPLHIVKWNMALPLKFSKDGMRVISSANLKNFMDNKTLEQLLTPKGASKLAIIMFVMGLIMGVLVGYVLPQILHGA